MRATGTVGKASRGRGPSKRITQPRASVAWADAAHTGVLVAWAKGFLAARLQVVSRPARAHGFVVLPHRTARDHERLVQCGEAWINLAAIATSPGGTGPGGAWHPLDQG